METGVIWLGHAQKAAKAAPFGRSSCAGSNIRRHKGNVRRPEKKKDVKIIAENFQTANVISKVRLIAAIPSMVSFHRWPSVISVISFISIFNAINILVSPLKFGFIHLLKVWHHDEPCKMGSVSKMYESLFHLVQASASAWLITFSGR